jgi:hypothetical protein
MMHWRKNWVWLPGLAVLLCSACQPVSDAWMAGWTRSESQDQIMLVRKDPPSLGQRRLTSLAGVYPDLGGFLRAHGSPEFLAETHTSNRHFLVLYYLTTQTSYVCQAKQPSTREISPAVPYTMSRRECNLLKDFQRQASTLPPEGAAR